MSSEDLSVIWDNVSLIGNDEDWGKLESIHHT